METTETPVSEPGRAGPVSPQPNPETPKLSLATKISYGIGSVAFGVKNNGFDYFLLIFYSQVIGLDPRLVGIAITTALIFDAMSDPVVGYWSDNLRSRWGRRHPFMYISVLPVSLSYFLLWNPPVGWSDASLFFYVLTLSVIIRTFITLYETPSTALTAELTEDYNERSSLLAFRYYFGWTGGNLMTVMMFFVVFPLFVTTTIPDGRFNRDSYAFYGVVGSLMMFAAILISALGTHNRIKYLKPSPPKRTLTLGRIFREIFDTLAERSFIALFSAALLGAVARGLAAALTFYFLTYFWGFGSLETGVITFGTFIAAVIGFVLAPIVSRTIGKKRGAVIIGLIAFLGSPLPIVLRLFDLLPENGTQFVFLFVLITGIIDVGLIICYQILSTSMMADLVEQSELKTGRRSEGLFAAAITFVQKAVQGFGLIAASWVLFFAQFPVGASPSEVSDDALWRLGAIYVPVILALWMTMIWAISTYKLEREDHEENLRKLAALRDGRGTDSSLKGGRARRWFSLRLRSKLK